MYPYQYSDVSIAAYGKHAVKIPAIGLVVQRSE